MPATLTTSFQKGDRVSGVTATGRKVTGEVKMLSNATVPTLWLDAGEFATWTPVDAATAVAA